MRIAAISDMHGYLPPIPGCEILLIAGDSSPVYDNHDPDGQARWWERTFGPWLAAQPGSYKVVIGGNHDFWCQRDPDAVRAWAQKWTRQGRGRIVYLQDETRDVRGIRVHGYPWVPNLERWAFYGDDNRLRGRLEMIPAATEILVSHGPPAGMGDETWGTHVGDPQMREMVRQLPALKLHVFGHIHEGHGTYGLPGRETLHLNVSHLDADYVGTRAPTLIDRWPGGNYTLTGSRT